MGIHIQRKRFDDREMALDVADSMADVDWKIPQVDVSARVYEDATGIWVEVTQQGDLVTGDEPLLPDYERVG